MSEIPDCEKLVSDYLRDELGVRVVGKAPSSTSTAWVMVTQLDAPQAVLDPVDRLVGFFLQLDCYAGSAGGQPEAVALSRSVRAALVALPEADIDAAAGVVSSARIDSSARIPDVTFEPARERFVMTATVHAHA